MVVHFPEGAQDPAQTQGGPDPEEGKFTPNNSTQDNKEGKAEITIEEMDAYIEEKQRKDEEERLQEEIEYHRQEAINSAQQPEPDTLERILKQIIRGEDPEGAEELKALDTTIIGVPGGLMLMKVSELIKELSDEKIKAFILEQEENAKKDTEGQYLNVEGITEAEVRQAFRITKWYERETQKRREQLNNLKETTEGTGFKVPEILEKDKSVALQGWEAVPKKEEATEVTEVTEVTGPETVPYVSFSTEELQEMGGLQEALKIPKKRGGRGSRKKLSEMKPVEEETLLTKDQLSKREWYLKNKERLDQERRAKNEAKKAEAAKENEEWDQKLTEHKAASPKKRGRKAKVQAVNSQEVTFQEDKPEGAQE